MSVIGLFHRALSACIPDLAAAADDEDAGGLHLVRLPQRDAPDGLDLHAIVSCYRERA